ncbi:uncharacterized protein FYW23_000988 isoform 3-T4 [Sylvia borin]
MRSRAPDAEVCWRSGSRGSRPGLSRAAAPAVPGGASPTGNTEYLSLVLVAVRAVCRGWAGCTHSGALPGGWGAPVRCRSEIKPCTCLTYPGVSWRLVNTTRCVRTRSCGRAALAPFSGTCERSIKASWCADRIPQTQGKDENLSGAAQVEEKGKWDSADRYSLPTHHELCAVFRDTAWEE